MDESWNTYSTSGLYDSVARSESLEEYKAILEGITNQKQNWIRTINNIMRENSFTAKTMAELCGVSRQSVQKWMKGAIPKSRDTYIKIGFAAKYDLEDMNYFLQRYGCCNKLYPKCLEDSVYIFVLTSDCIEHSYKSCKTIIKMLKEEISAGGKEQNVEDYSTSSLVMDIKNLIRLVALLENVIDNNNIQEIPDIVVQINNNVKKRNAVL